MSNHPNGQHYYSSYTSGPQYTSPVQGQPGGLQRTSSFDAGDDARFFDRNQAQPQQNPAYPTYGGSPVTQPSHQPYVPSAAPQTSLPYRSGSYGYGTGGYQHQQQPQQSSNVTYNPAQYQPHSYNPQTYSPPQPSYQANTYQPYVPSAYQDSVTNRQSTIQNSYYNTSPQQYAHPPPPPPRPSDPSYGTQNVAYSGYQHQSQGTSSYSQGAPYVPGSYYTTSPTAPPPPPHHDNNVRPYAHSTASPYDQPGYTGHGNSTLSSTTSTDIHRNYSSASHASQVSTISSSFANSSQPSIPTPPTRNTSLHSPQRSNTLDRHPQGHALPGLPSESESDNDYFAPHALATPGGSAMTGYEAISSHFEPDMNQSVEPLFSDSGHTDLSPDEKPTHLNGIVSTGDHNINYGAFANDSDAEAAAGVAAMQAAEKQEAEEEQRRRSGNTTSADAASRTYLLDRSDDSDYAGYDLSLAGGGYAGTMSYGNTEVSHYAAAAAAMPSGDYSRLNPRMDSVRSTGVSSDGRGSQTSGYESIPASESVHPFPPLRTDIARVDTGGTGGLTEPSSAIPRRLSYDDGDEIDLMHEGSSPSRESIPDLFFHPGMSRHRALPPPPPQHTEPGSRLPHLVPAGTSPHQTRFSQYDSTSQAYSTAPEVYQNQAQQASVVPRSTSMATNRTVSKPEQPIRSKTDADRARIQRQPERSYTDMYEVSSPQSGVGLDLPTLPRKKFNPTMISSEQFRKCSAPWALSAILSWVKDLAEDEIDLKEHALAEAVVALFTYKVPTMNTTEAEALGDLVINQMLHSGALVKDEEWVKFGIGEISGVLYQLTGSGCYSSKLHLYPSKGRCYANMCMRTLKKVDLTLPSERTEEDWITYYKLQKDDIEKYDKKEIERQMNQHEIVTGEDNYIAGLDLLRILYRDQIQAAQPPLLPPKKLTGFIRDVFGFVDKVKKVNEDYLLAQLKYRQNEQGPFIVGFSDIFREWIRRARGIYVEYANAYPKADYLVRREAERNGPFRQLLDQCRQDPRAKRLAWDNYLKSPIQRLQRYGLLLDTVMKNMVKDSTEKVNLAMAIDEIKSATHDANQAYARAEKDMELLELANKIKLRKAMEVVELNLDHKGRQIHMRGDLQRASGRGFQMVDTHAILFDHYLVLAKTLISRDPVGARRQEQYDVSKTPIPMDLISLESTNDPAVVKSSVKGIATVTTTVTPRGQAPDPRLNRTTSSNSGGTLQHSNTGFSAGSSSASGSLVPSTTLSDASNRDDKVMYPFRVKHLGKSDVYVLFAGSAELREQWCSAIIFAKEQHAEALHAQNAEPFKLRVLADTAFGTESSSAGNKGVLIRDTPLHRAVQQAEKRYAGNGRPAPICRAAVNCATVFQQPHGRFMCAIGTDYGVYISEFSNPRGWIRVIQMTKVTQIAVLEEFNLFLLISDKVLIAYHLDVVCPVSGPITPQNDGSLRKAPQKLSGAKDVAFFQTGKMKDRALVFYKKRDGLNSVFKVLEPVLQKSATSRSRFLPTSTRRGQTDFFRDYDEFYIPTECYSINIFNSSLGISTSRGFEVLTLDKKLPWTVPNLTSETPDAQAHLSSIAARIKDLKPLGMFRLSQSEFLVTFTECAVYVNQHGDISRGVVMEFVGRANSACLYEQYLILCNDDFVEIRDAQNGRLKQVIAGKEMKMIDDGGNLMPGTSQQHANTSASLGGGANGLGVQGFQPVPRSVKLCLLHPEYEKSYVVVELLFASETDKE